MEAKSPTTEAIALTEKKMDMTLDELIKLSKSENASKPKKQRVSNRGQKFACNATAVDKSWKLQRSRDTCTASRQGALAQRRSNFQVNEFPPATEAARKVAAIPIRNRAFKRSRPFNVNIPRLGGPTVHKEAASGGLFSAKKKSQPANVAPKQRPQTLDSLFAHMKEQRQRVLSQHLHGSRRDGGGHPIVPWARNHLHN